MKNKHCDLLHLISGESIISSLFLPEEMKLESFISKLLPNAWVLEEIPVLLSLIKSVQINDVGSKGCKMKNVHHNILVGRNENRLSFQPFLLFHSNDIVVLWHVWKKHYHLHTPIYVMGQLRLAEEAPWSGARWPGPDSYKVTGN